MLDHLSRQRLSLFTLFISLSVGLSACIDDPQALNSELDAGDSAQSPEPAEGGRALTAGEMSAPSAGGAGRPPRPQPAGFEPEPAGVTAGGQGGFEPTEPMELDPPPPPDNPEMVKEPLSVCWLRTFVLQRS